MISARAREVLDAIRSIHEEAEGDRGPGALLTPLQSARVARLLGVCTARDVTWIWKQLAPEEGS